MDMWMDVDVALAEVPVNLLPLLDDTDFKTVEGAVAYNAAGMDLRWNFVSTAGAYTSTPVTPTTSGTYDWVHQGDGMYSIEIPASGGASINNDTEGFGWFSGFATGVLPWRGPIIGFRAAALNDALIDGGDNLDVNVTQFVGSAATASGGRPEVNTTAINGGTSAAANLRRSAEGIYYGSVTTNSSTTTVIDSALTQSAADHWKGRIVIFLTGALALQGTRITAFTPGTDTLTVEALTGAPQSGDTYVIL